MRKFKIIFYLTVALSQVSFISTLAHANEFSYTFDGIIYEQPTYFFINDDNLINPDNDILELSDWINRLYGRVNLNLKYKNAQFISQFRPTLTSDEDETDGEFITDDAYLDLNIYKEGYFLYCGKRNIRDVVAYGANPTDFLGEGKDVDYTKREEERRVERQGNYMVGLDSFFPNTRISAIFAPEFDWDDVSQKEDDRFLLRANYFAEEINTDMTLHLFQGEIPGIGFDVSSTVSDQLILYTENSLRWGSNKYEIKLTREGDAYTPREYEVTDPDDDDDVYANIVIGGSYTFDNGTNLILEYIYNGDGYDSGEWDNIVDFTKYHNDLYKSGAYTDLAKGNLAMVNSDIMKIREMRKNYIFCRVSNSKILENTDAQIVLQLNADDMSYLITPIVDYKITNNFVVGISATIFRGDDDSEFGMMYWGADASLVLRYYL
jgi:hypothetical protein